MTAPDRLKLQAIDEEDLAVLSAHVQDAVLKVGDLIYLPKEQRFAIAMNRFGWEGRRRRRRRYERRRSALIFDRVTAAQVLAISAATAPTRCSSCSPSASSRPTRPPAMSRSTLPAGAMLRLEVECIEARLADLGPAWATAAKPSHELAADPVETA